jgi:glycosyltransferase involved in cell wall biosynthesis
VDLLNMLALPVRAPDVILVHELAVAMQFARIREWYPHVPAGLYHHGGEVPSVRPHDAVRAAEAFRSFDRVFVNTEFARAQAIARDCPPELLVTLPVGFDLADYPAPAQRPYRRTGTLRLLSAGRLSEEKGIEHAIRAVGRAVATGRNGIRYAIAGDGYQRPLLEALVDELDLRTYVEFLGVLDTSRLIGELERADAIVLPSVSVPTWSETQACAVQEAMLTKALVITTTTGGVPESIAPEMQRFAVEERSAEALAAAICDVYDMTERELAGIGAAGRSFVEERYDIAALNRSMLKHLLD